MKSSASKASVRWHRARKSLRLLKSYLILSFAIVLASAATFTGCFDITKEGGDRPSIRTYAKSVFVSGTDVYVAGRVERDLNDMAIRSSAVLWKNGVIRYLDSFSAIAGSVFVSGDDVYVAGYDGGAVLWKNNEVSQRLTVNGLDRTTASSVFVSGGDVYVAGAAGVLYTDQIVPILWKNGAAQLLNNEKNNRGEALFVFVSEGDVYVAGYERSVNGIRDIAVIWKNGVPQYLTDRTSSAAATSVFVFDGDVYVTGSDGSLWKNGDTQRLTSALYYRPVASSVFVSGGDVYVAGQEVLLYNDRRVVIWKNGFPQYLTNKGGFGADANSVFVSDNDVYVAGSVDWVATIWKNGVAQRLNR